MNTETINQIKDALAPIAEKIGQGAGYAWEIVVRQQVAEGIGALIVSFFGLILGISVFCFVKYTIKKHESWRDDWDVVGGMVGTIGGIISLLMLITGLYGGVMRLLNPEFYAIEFFINLVK